MPKKASNDPEFETNIEQKVFKILTKSNKKSAYHTDSLLFHEMQKGQMELGYWKKLHGSETREEK